MHVDLHACFVLHRHPYRESSLLLELYSAVHGRLPLVARGARRPRSPWRTLLEPFRPLQIAWSGRGEVGTLVAAEPEGLAPALHGHTLACAFYLNELLLRLLPRHDPAPQLFARYQDTLAALPDPAREQPALRLFELTLLESLGYGLCLDREIADGAAIDAGVVYRYCADAGPRRQAPTGTSSVEVSGATLLALARGRPEGEQCLAESRRLMRFLLAPHLGERPLASRALLRTRGRGGPG